MSRFETRDLEGVFNIDATSLLVLSIVVLSYNRREEVERNIHTLGPLVEEKGLDVVIVDNASTDGTVELLLDAKRLYPSLRVIYNDRNLGVAAGRNLGWKTVARPWILNIDDDTHVVEADLLAMLAAAREQPELGALSPRIVHAITGRPQCEHGRDFAPIANFHGACHLVKREAFNCVGDLDESCSFGGEELDYSIRLRSSGYQVAYVPSVTVMHNNFERSGTEREWRRQQWVYNFTRVLFKHFPLRTAALFSVRYLTAQVISGFRSLGPVFALSLVGRFFLGAKTGRKVYSKIPYEVQRFYSDPTLTPEFGNRSLSAKCIDVLRRNGQCLKK